MAGELVLRCVHAPLFRLVVSRQRAVLGRSDECDLVVDDPSISRRHAEMRVRKARLVVTDLGSRNGTQVDGRRVQTAAVLPGQLVQFAAVPFTVHDADEVDDDADEATDPQPLESAGAAPGPLPAVDRLSEAQRRVFERLLTGAPEKVIARRLDLSPHTVHNHVRAILRVFGVHSRLELVAAFLRDGAGHG